MGAHNVILLALNCMNDLLLAIFRFEFIAFGENLDCSSLVRVNFTGHPVGRNTLCVFVALMTEDNEGSLLRDILHYHVVDYFLLWTVLDYAG